MRFLIVLLMLIVPSHLFAGDGVYVKGNVGVFMLEDSDIGVEVEGFDAEVGEVTSNTGFGLSGAIGKSLNSGFDVELEFAYREAGLDELEWAVGLGLPSEEIESSIDIKTLMGNTIYNFRNASNFNPYIGVGIGMGWVDVEDFSDTKFAYQFLAGLETSLTDRASLLLGYRYLGMEDISYGGSVEGYDATASASIDSHTLELGLKYSF